MNRSAALKKIAAVRRALDDIERELAAEPEAVAAAEPVKSVDDEKAEARRKLRKMGVAV